MSMSYVVVPIILIAKSIELKFAFAYILHFNETEHPIDVYFMWQNARRPIVRRLSNKANSYC